METNETVKAALVQAAEQEMYNLLTALQEVPSVTFKDVEQQVMQAVFAPGARWLGDLLSGQAQQEAPARREGECGHRQRVEARWLIKDYQWLVS